MNIIPTRIGRLAADTRTLSVNSTAMISARAASRHRIRRLMMSDMEKDDQGARTNTYAVASPAQRDVAKAYAEKLPEYSVVEPCLSLTLAVLRDPITTRSRDYTPHLFQKVVGR
jgi:hypothetical protein